jgi:ribosomal protein S18 acetylase RimI-like enzyme
VDLIEIITTDTTPYWGFCLRENTVWNDRGLAGMDTGFSVTHLKVLPPDRLADLLVESEREGFAFVRRLVDDWESGDNRFDRAGEVFFAAVDGGRVVGVCGLNNDPYLPGGRVGRVRHLYVSAAFRRRGIGAELIAAVILAGRGTFDRLRLRTESESAARFYESLGFRRTDGEPDCSHVRDLTG